MFHGLFFFSGSQSRDPPHNIGKPVHPSSNRKVLEERRFSFPLDLPDNKQWGNIQHHHSEALLRQVKKGGELKLGMRICYG